MLFELSWLGAALIALALTQLVIALVTVYFHRACAHLSITLSPATHRACRFLSWFLIAMDPQEFAAVHRKHHAKCDTQDDPHSPANHGWHGVLFGGLGLYRKEAHNPDTIAHYGKGLPLDPWEGFYRRHKNLGILLQAALLVGLFGAKGLIIWGLMMLWIPFWAAGVINGLGHHVGYRNFQTQDLSTNLSPWGLWIGGEELHNNHHAYPARAKFSIKPWEIDLGWGVISVLRFFGLATVREVSSQNPVTAFLRARHEWLHDFQVNVNQNLTDIKAYGFSTWSQLSAAAQRAQRASRRQKERLSAALADPLIAQLHQLEKDLLKFWDERGSFTPDAVNAWKKRAQELAQQCSWPWLDDFSARLPELTPRPA